MKPLMAFGRKELTLWGKLSFDLPGVLRPRVPRLCGLRFRSVRIASKARSGRVSSPDLALFLAGNNYRSANLPSTPRLGSWR